MTGKELFEEAQALLIEGKDAESVKRLNEAIEAGHDPYMCHLSRGVARLKMKDTAEASADFTRAIELNPENSRPYYYRGMVDLMDARFDQAVEDFGQAIKLKPSMPVAQFARAVAYARMKKFDDAVKDLRAVFPQIQANVQSVVDSYGIVRTEMWKVMSQLAGERKEPSLELTDDEIGLLKRWIAGE